MIAGGNDRLFALVCDAVDLPELASDERFRTNPDRVRNREELVEILSARLRERGTAQWHEQLTSVGVPAAPVADVADVIASPQTEAIGLLQLIPHSDIPDLRLPALPLSFDGERAEHRSPPPRVGEHTSDVLRELGYSEDEIEELENASVVRLASAN
jgi:crotonobetainyl-CoA:carnitine CoA-transferase CaiB-like acyl-CoA transferase